MTTTEHTTRRPLRRDDSPTGRGPSGVSSYADAPQGVAVYDADHPGQLETLCVGEAR